MNIANTSILKYSKAKGKKTSAMASAPCKRPRRDDGNAGGGEPDADMGDRPLQWRVRCLNPDFEGSDPHHTLAQMCRGLLKQVMDGNEALTDLTFVLDDMSTVRAHKGILSERSSYMRQMLCSNMIETSKGEVRVRECSRQSFLAFLQVIYTTQLSPSENGLSVDGSELWKLTDVFDVADLKDHLALSLYDDPSSVPGDFIHKKLQRKCLLCGTNFLRISMTLGFPFLCKSVW